MAGGQHGQVLLLLLLGAVGQNGVAAQAVVGRHNVARGCALLRKLLHADRCGQRVCARAAVLLGNAHAHHAQVEQLLDVLPGVLAGLVRLRCDGLHFVLSELRHHLPDQLVLTAQIEIHVVFSLYQIFERSVRLEFLRCSFSACLIPSGGISFHIAASTACGGSPPAARSSVLIECLRCPWPAASCPGCCPDGQS